MDTIDRESLVMMLRAGHTSPMPLESGVGLTPQRLRPERVWQQIRGGDLDINK